jgi:hypothetical protein
MGETKIMESRKDDHLLIFDEAKHRYTLDGNRIPGATTFGKGGYPTSEQLIGWQVGEGSKYTARIIQRLRKNNPTRVIEGELLAKIVKKSKKASGKVAMRAAGIGTIVHDFAYLVELGRVREALQMLSEHESHRDWDKINNGVKKFEGWHEQNKGETVLLEAIVASVVHQFGGKFDHLSLRNGLLILSDYKTSNGIYVDQFIQLASYAIAIEEWLDKWLAEYKLPLKVGGLEILRFGKEDGEMQQLLITNPEEIEQLKYQAIRCRQTYKFRLGWENDKRFKWNGGASATKSGDTATQPGIKRISRKQRDKDSAGKVG